MNRLLRITILFLLLATTERAGAQLRDSLQRVLEHTQEPSQRIGLLLNILDLTEEEAEEYRTAQLLCREARAAGDSFALAATLGPITQHLIEMPDRRDSLLAFLDRAERQLAGTPEEGVGTYYRTVCRARDLSAGDPDTRIEQCEALSRQLAQKQPGNAFEQAGRLFLLGCADYVLTAATGLENRSPVPYLEEAWTIASSFPPAARKNFCGNIYTLLSQLYNDDAQDQKLIDISNAYLSMLDAYFAQEVVRRRRPYFYKDNLYLLCYQQLMLNSKVIGPERAREYFERFRRYMQEGRGDPLQRDRFFLYSFSYSYYAGRQEYPEALASIDSLIRHIETTHALNIRWASYYKARADVLRRMKRYDQACKAYLRAQEVADSVSRNQHMEQIGELQVGYEIDRLKLATARLSAHRHRIALFSSLGLLLLAAAFCIHTYRHLRRTRRLQSLLLEQRSQAAAAGKHKTEFINSICHEVRTPLNCVYGFSELLYEEKDPALQSEYAEIIEANSSQLAFLLNDLLEVTYLENLALPLPIEPCDVEAVCRKVFEWTKAQDKGRLEFRIEGRKVSIRTNGRYLGLLVGCLLANARKFTERGSILLRWELDPLGRRLRVEVTDTGCGIPAADRERIFGRFVKLDPFRPGNGLGLYLCRLIASKLGGTVTLDASHTPGTRMVVDLHAEP